VKISTYYIMGLDQNMVETIALYMPGRSQIVRGDWLTEEELLVYSGAFAKTGFQSGLNWYRCTTSDTHQLEQELFADQRIDVPACFIAGSSDWGGYQKPGDFGKLKAGVCFASASSSCNWESRLLGAAGATRRDEPVIDRVSGITQTLQAMKSLLDDSAQMAVIMRSKILLVARWQL
jgi:hypothetical protein